MDNIGCPLFKVSIIRGSTVYKYMHHLGFLLLDQ